MPEEEPQYRLQPLELIVSSALASLAALVPDSGLRVVLVLIAPPTGHLLVKLGRRYFQRRTSEFPLRRLRSYLKKLEKARNQLVISASERRLNEQRIKETSALIHDLELRRAEVLLLQPREPTEPDDIGSHS